MSFYTLSDIRGLEPCYDPGRYLPEDWSGTLVDGLRIDAIPAADRIWVAVRLLDPRMARLFAVWCARRALARIENPDPRSIAACDVAERYANGDATREELGEAWDTAGDVGAAAWDAWAAAGNAAWAAARAAAGDAARDAARAAWDAARALGGATGAAAWAAARDAAWAATRDAAGDATRDAAWDATRDAAWAAWAAARAAAWDAQDAAWAARDAERQAQIDQLIHMLENPKEM